MYSNACHRQEHCSKHEPQQVAQIKKKNLECTVWKKYIQTPVKVPDSDGTDWKDLMHFW